MLEDYESLKEEFPLKYLEVIDFKTIRPLRSILAAQENGTKISSDDLKTLQELEEEAAKIRAEIKE